MENFDDCCNKRKDDLSKCESPSSDNYCALREASNVIILVSDSSETGKYIQTLWYLKHINSAVAIEASNKDENGINVVKISAQDGNIVHDDEQLLVTSNTLISYVVQSYRFVFVIDISPSTFVVDGTASCVPHSKIIKRLRQCLEGLLMQRSFLATNKFSPQLFITICFYSPFIAFDEDRTVLDDAASLEKMESRTKEVAAKSRRSSTGKFFRQQFHAADGFRDSIHGLLTTQMTFRAGPADEGFINSECSIVFMLRAGLIGLQLLPDTAQPNIVLITDAVCNVTDIRTLQKLMVQLRNYSVACSFIQIQGDCNTNAVFGHFSSPEFFTFLSKGTSGAYIPDDDQTTADDILDIIDCRPLLCKNLQLLNVTDDYIKDLIHQINPEFVEPYALGVIRRIHYSMEYESCLEYFLRSRLHEGFILREDQSSTLVELSLPWKPQVTIGYKIYALSEDYTKGYFDVAVTKLKITVICEAQYGMIRDLLSDRCSVNTTKQTFSDAYRHAILDLFHFPSEILKEKSLFRYVIKENKAFLTISTRELETLCSQNVAAANFVEFWRIISEFEERHCRRTECKVTSQLALTVFYDMLGQMTTFSLVHGQTYVKFVEENDDGIPKSFYIVKLSLEAQLIVIKFAFLNHLTAAFRNEVIKEYREKLSSLSVERSCFFTKMLEFADVGDDCVTVTETMQLPALTIISRPLEIMLARYKKIPLALNRIIRLEKADEANGDVILHNSLAKYFSCRRFIWYLKKAFSLSSVVSCTYADFILHTILQRRVNEGFHIAYGDNGIINLVKHVDGLEQQLYCGSALLQYIIFPPTAIRPMRIVKEHLEQGTTLSKIHEIEVKKSVPSGSSALKNDFDIQLMTEIWSEPLAVIDPKFATWTGTIQQQANSYDEGLLTDRGFSLDAL
ncbi:hypothetical protein DINM_004776 [Dirofilaria immitis]|nr:hypothetical protein [Dirofilaria immitis]